VAASVRRGRDGRIVRGSFAARTARTARAAASSGACGEAVLGKPDSGRSRAHAGGHRRASERRGAAELTRPAPEPHVVQAAPTERARWSSDVPAASGFSAPERPAAAYSTVAAAASSSRDGVEAGRFGAAASPAGSVGPERSAVSAVRSERAAEGVRASDLGRC